MSGTVLQCIYYKVGEREIVWISLPLKREGKFVLPCIIPVGQYSLSTPEEYNFKKILKIENSFQIWILWCHHIHQVILDRN